MGLPNNLTLASEIKSLRKAKSYTQSDVASVLKLGLSTYAGKETYGRFDESEVTKIAALFKVDAKPLLALLKNTQATINDSLQFITEEIILIRSMLETQLDISAELLQKVRGGKNISLKVDIESIKEEIREATNEKTKLRLKKL